MQVNVYGTGHAKADVRIGLDAIAKGQNVSFVCSKPVSMAIATAVVFPDGKAWESVEGFRNYRCRKCAGCLRLRMADWAFRAAIEFATHQRTWWVTLTYRERLPGQPAPSYKDVQLFLKRIRKGGNPVRFCCSEELGDQFGRLHFHVLMHCDKALTRRFVDGCWPHGFCHARLAKTAGLGGYLAKYLAKSSRVRASTGYGGETRWRDALPRDVDDALEQYLRTGEGIGFDEFVTRFGVRLPKHWLARLQPPAALKLIASIPF